MLYWSFQQIDDTIEAKRKKRESKGGRKGDKKGGIEN